MATFALRSFFGEPASCEHVSTTYGAKTSSRILEEPGEERHQSRIRSRVDLKTCSAWRSCVLVSSPYKICDLFKEHIDLHESSNASSAFFQTPQTLQVKSARSKSWGAAHERTNAVSFVFYAYWRNRSHMRGRGMMKQIPALMTWHCVLFSLPIPFLDAAMYVHGCAMPWCVPRGALLIECSEQHAVSMPALGVNVVSIRAPIFMLAQTRKKQERNVSSHDSAQSHMQQLCVTARVQPLVRWHGHSLV